MTTPPIVEWANGASKEEIDAWIIARLHGRERRWPEANGGSFLLSHVVAVVARHPQTSPVAFATIIQCVLHSLRLALVEWAKLGEEVREDTVAGGWSASALGELLYLAGEILESRARRTELKYFLVEMAPRLPKRVGDEALRSKALATILELGGHADMNFWLTQCDESQPETIPLAFHGIAKQDVDSAMAWLGKQSLEVQGDAIRKLRPSLVKMTGGEIPFLILARQHLFRSNRPLAKELRGELAPLGELVLFLLWDDLPLAEKLGGRVIPSLVRDGPDIALARMFVVYQTERELYHAAAEIAVDRYLRDYLKKPGLPRLEALKGTTILMKYVRGDVPPGKINPEMSEMLEQAIRRRQAELV